MLGCKTDRLCIAVSMLVLTHAAVACDLCQLYARAPGRSFRGIEAGLSSQWSAFETLRLDGHEVPNPESESMRSSITQVVLAVRVASAVTLQVNLPWIDRTYRRSTELGVERGSERGGGDVALSARYDGRGLERSGYSYHWFVIGGLELPTGTADRLAEELAAHEEEPTTLHHLRGGRAHTHVHESGVHGHDLALGNGAVDMLFGAGGRWTTSRLEVDARLDYSLRRTGDFGYRYADDAHLGVSSRWFLGRGERHRWAVGVGLLGEHKGKDTISGETLQDSAITAVYIAPLVRFQVEERIASDLALEFPLVQDNSALQIVPDRRLRFALTASF